MEGLDARLRKKLGERLFSLGGPTCAGKDTVVSCLLTTYPQQVMRLPRVTTRPKRPSETEGVHYFFVDQPTFSRRVLRGRIGAVDVYAGKLSGISMRVPVILPSVINLTLEIKKLTTKDFVNQLLKQAVEKEMKGVMDYSDEPLVSIDYKKNPHASIIDGLSTEVIDKKMVNLVAWYDNEWGYVNQLVKLIEYVGLQ